MKKKSILLISLILLTTYFINAVKVDATVSLLSEETSYINDVYNTNDPFTLDHKNSAFVYGDDKSNKIYGTGSVGEYNSATVTQSYHIVYWNVSSDGDVANSLGTGYTKSNNAATTNNQITYRETADKNDSFVPLGVYTSNDKLYYYSNSANNTGTYNPSLSSYFTSPKDYSFGLNHSLIVNNTGDVYSSGYSNGMGRVASTRSSLSYTGSTFNNTTYSSSTTAQTSVTYAKTSITNAIGASAGNDHSLILLADGSLYAGGSVGVTGLKTNYNTSFAKTISKEEASSNGGIKDFKAGLDCSYVLYNNGILLEASSEGWNEVANNVKLIDIDYAGYLYYATKDNSIYKVDILEDFNPEFVVNVSSNILQIRGGSTHWGYLTAEKQLFLYDNETKKELILDDIVFFDTGSDTYGYLTTDGKLSFFGDERWIGGLSGVEFSNIPYGHLTSDDIEFYTLGQKGEKIKLNNMPLYSMNELYIDYSVYNIKGNETKFQFVGTLYDEVDSKILDKNGIYIGEEFYFSDLDNEFTNKYSPTASGDYTLIVKQYNSLGQLISLEKNFNFEIINPKISDNFLSFDFSNSIEDRVVNYIPGINYNLRLDSIDEFLIYFGTKVSIEIKGDDFSSNFDYYRDDEFVNPNEVWEYMPSTKNGEYLCIVTLEFEDGSGAIQKLTSSSTFTLKILKYSDDDLTQPEDVTPPSTDELPQVEDVTPPLADDSSNNIVWIIMLPVSLVIGLVIGVFIGKRK